MTQVFVIATTFSAISYVWSVLWIDCAGVCMVYDGHTDSEHPVPLLTLTETLDAARWLVLFSEGMWWVGSVAVSGVLWVFLCVTFPVVDMYSVSLNSPLSFVIWNVINVRRRCHLQSCVMPMQAITCAFQSLLWQLWMTCLCVSLAGCQVTTDSRWNCIHVWPALSARWICEILTAG